MPEVEVRRFITVFLVSPQGNTNGQFRTWWVRPALWGGSEGRGGGEELLRLDIGVSASCGTVNLERNA